MQANWSLILNVLLLIGVVVAITRLMKVRRQSSMFLNSSAVAANQPTLSREQALDGIISVRKLPKEEVGQGNFAHEVDPKFSSNEFSDLLDLDTHEASFDSYDKKEPVQSLMIFLSAKENRLLAGYELLQTVLAAGLRFGEGNLFHRHQYANGHGPILCSLAAATPTGVFDLPNMGAFSTRGLCLFMQSCGNPTIDSERFKIMLTTAKQLANDLDSHILDDKQRPFTKDSLTSYCYRLQIKHWEELSETLTET